MSVGLSSEITAIATAVLAAFAFATAILATLAFLKQSQEVRILQRQAKEQQEVLARDASEHRRAQAARVFTGSPQITNRISGAAPYARNASNLPVYDAQLWYSDSDHLSRPDDLGMILPGEEIKSSNVRIYNVRDFALAKMVLTFRDAAGVRWIRMPDGTLKEQTLDTALESVLAALAAPLPSLPDRS